MLALFPAPSRSIIQKMTAMRRVGESRCEAPWGHSSSSGGQAASHGKERAGAAVVSSEGVGRCHRRPTAGCSRPPAHGAHQHPPRCSAPGDTAERNHLPTLVCCLARDRCLWDAAAKKMLLSEYLSGCFPK